ncbi:MAG: S4 domain-containing protein [Candidatus Marsarchaeota archaeon]|jgi:small subunit ribosomal protein S4e|nr:S4 domain-containing protein [Candidatus Marsarchaeota archaeon]
MAGKGNKRHLKSIAAPKYFAVHRKEFDYVRKPNAGRHSAERSVALSYALKQIGHVSTTADADRAIKRGSIEVNGRVVREPKYPVGLSDVISVGPDKVSKRLGINNLGKMVFDEVSEKDDIAANTYKVVGKYKAGAGRLILRLHDGRNVEADARTNDSVVLKGGKVAKVLKLEKGARCFVIDGVHVGAYGTVSQLNKGDRKRDASVVINPESGEQFETLVKNIMIVV